MHGKMEMNHSQTPTHVHKFMVKLGLLGKKHTVVVARMSKNAIDGTYNQFFSPENRIIVASNQAESEWPSDPQRKFV